MRHMLNKKILISLIAFLLLNLISALIIYIKLDENIFGKSYVLKKSRYQIGTEYSRLTHPYIGEISNKDLKLETNLITDEKLFYHISQNNINSDNKIHILILGGTLAKNLTRIEDLDSKSYNNNLLKFFKNSFPNKKIIIHNASVKSAKQPQQMFKLYYLYLLGYKADLVINFDGPQEITHPITKNYNDLGDQLIYPKRYSNIILEMGDSKKCSENLKNQFNNNTYIPILELFSLYRIQNCRKKATYENQKDNWRKNIKKLPRSEEEIINISKNIWAESSIQMNDFLTTRGATYLHVLMPNQHVPKSKIFSEQEKKTIYGSQYERILKDYYSDLNFDSQKIPHLLDLRYIFKNFKDTVYIDDCCRMNNQGFKMISKEIVNYINKEKILDK